MTVSISISQIFRSWVAISQLRPPMASLFRSLYDMVWLAPRIDVLRNICFHRVSATGMASRQGTLTPPDTWSRPFGNLHMFYVLRPILFPNLSLFFRTMLFEYPSVLSRFCLILRATRLSNKLLQQGYAKELLRSSLRKFYGRYGDLIKQYEDSPLMNLKWHSVTWQYTMTTHYWSDFKPSRDLITNSTYRILRGFHYRTFATGVACRQGTLTPAEPGPVPLGLTYVLLVETNPFSELVMIFRTLHFEHPSVLSRFVLVTLGDIIMLQTYYFL